MTRRLGDLSCADCAKPMWSGKGTLPQGRARCLACRRANPARPPQYPRKTYEPRTCNVCDKTYTPKASNSRYCSTGCHAQRSRGPGAVVRQCEICQQRYMPSYSKQRTCSRECGKWITKNLVCAVEWMACGMCSKPYAKAIERGFGTCSSSCADEARAILFRPAVVKDDSWKHEDRECPRCAATFRLVDRGEFMASTTLYCSKRCARKATKLKRRVREVGSYGDWRWSDFMRIAAKFNYRCAYCDEKPERLDPDHVIPLAKNGPNTTTNLLPACATCNSQKTDMLLHEWADYRHRHGLSPRRTSWADDDPRYFHLTALRSMETRRSAA